MRNSKTWLLVMVFVALLGGFYMATVTAPSTSAAPPAVGPGDWRYHDGHWNYWDPSDRRWYYTDGRSWYYYGSNNAWHPYNFDRRYGSEHFYRGNYRMPEGANIELPRHGIYIAPR
jgi:hypothetical protein